mmetsp:Transcript_101927/g.287655  ORF Transcript_101927/g.287655 Transcript_101927/m.287655 type:complete len:250 (+) Transcript_101927:593-1342(+)
MLRPRLLLLSGGRDTSRGCGDLRPNSWKTEISSVFVMKVGEACMVVCMAPEAARLWCALKVGVPAPGCASDDPPMVGFGEGGRQGTLDDPCSRARPVTAAAAAAAASAAATAASAPLTPPLTPGPRPGAAPYAARVGEAQTPGKAPDAAEGCDAPPWISAASWRPKSSMGSDLRPRDNSIDADLWDPVARAKPSHAEVLRLPQGRSQASRLPPLKSHAAPFRLPAGSSGLQVPPGQPKDGASDLAGPPP